MRRRRSGRFFAARLATARTAAGLASGAKAEEWPRYHNERFGATADYPAGWTTEPAPENNDGRRFVSPDGRASLTISGIFATDSRNAELDEKATPMPGETVTYRAARDNWIVLSGTRNGRIFYRKAILSCGGEVWNDLDIDYPVEEKTEYDALAAHIAASLRPGSGYDLKCK
ncbi:hypothetical protein [Rhodoblastus sp.]|uniref:hypothetical protein n=1 Tax=Rhodoblastus sp. TaxID=1962975 RepID=UPI0035B3E1DF